MCVCRSILLSPPANPRRQTRRQTPLITRCIYVYMYVCEYIYFPFSTCQSTPTYTLNNKSHPGVSEQ